MNDWMSELVNDWMSEWVRVGVGMDGWVGDKSE